MRIELYKGVAWATEATVPALVLTAAELDQVIDDSRSVADYVRRINGLAADCGHTVDDRPCGQPYCAGIPTVCVWLDGVTQRDTTRLAVGVFHGRAKSRWAKGTPEYMRQGKGFFVRVESHCMIG